jgi:hypothetical protein
MMRKKSRQLSHYSEKLVIVYWLISTSWYSTAHLVCGDCHTYKVCCKACGRAIVVRDANHFEGGDIPAVCISMLVAGPRFQIYGPSWSLEYMTHTRHWCKPSLKAMKPFQHIKSMGRTQYCCTIYHEEPSY